MNIDDRDPERKARRGVALKWWTRLDSGPLSPEESRAFTDWLTEDSHNKFAFDEVAQLWGDLESIRPYVAQKAPAPRRRRRLVPAALAAGIAVLAMNSDELTVLLRATERTGVGETKLVVLPDGSHAQLGAESAIAIDFRPDVRRLTLLRGESWFDVAPDASRPFSVSAGGGLVTALGTSFDIATDGSRTEVTVTRHRVRISGGGPNVIVEEGRQSAFGPNLAPAPPYPVDVDQVTAWRRGKLVFEDKPLGEVVSALSKYHHGYLLIMGSETRKRRVSGVFDVSDPLGAIRIIERSLGVNALFFSDYFVVLRG